MAQVFGFIPIELRPGVKGEDFEKFWREEYAPFPAKLGWKVHILKADRGERDGKYAVIWEVGSVEDRNRQVPAWNQMSDEVRQTLGPTFRAVNNKLMTFVIAWSVTDYVELGEP